MSGFNEMGPVKDKNPLAPCVKARILSCHTLLIAKTCVRFLGADGKV